MEALRATSPEVIYAQDLEAFLTALTAVEEEQERSIANLVAQQKQALKGRKGPAKVCTFPSSSSSLGIFSIACAKKGQSRC